MAFALSLFRPFTNYIGKIGENSGKRAPAGRIVGSRWFFCEYCSLTTVTMTFDERGNLTPYQLIPSDLETIRTIFVELFPDSITRWKIFDAFTAYLNELKSVLNEPLEIWVDGSFTTQKQNPGDVDFVIFVDRQIAAIHVDAIYRFRQKRYGEKSLTDGYFVEIVPQTHPDYRIYRFNQDDKYRDFAFDRLGNPKGFLQVYF